MKNNVACHRKRHLLSYFGSHKQNDLLKNSTFPEEVGHLVTCILVERPDVVLVRSASKFFLSEVVKSQLRSIADPHYPENPITFND